MDEKDLVEGMREYISLLKMEDGIPRRKVIKTR